MAGRRGLAKTALQLKLYRRCQGQPKYRKEFDANLILSIQVSKRPVYIQLRNNYYLRHIKLHCNINNTPDIMNRFIIFPASPCR